MGGDISQGPRISQRLLREGDSIFFRDELHDAASSPKSSNSLEHFEIFAEYNNELLNNGVPYQASKWREFITMHSIVGWHALISMAPGKCWVSL